MPLIYLHLSIAKDAADRLGHPVIGSQMGSYLGGGIFDATNSYRMAFGVAALAGFIAVIAAMRIRRQLKTSGDQFGNL